jgi:hypothetical protein
MADELHTIKLDKPIKAHGGPCKAIVLREPLYEDYLNIGDVYSVAQTVGGQVFAVDNMPNIRQYIETCLVEPKDPALLNQLPAKIAKKLKDTILGFFREDAGSDTSETSRTNSSSEAGPSGQQKSKS